MEYTNCSAVHSPDIHHNNHIIIAISINRIITNRPFIFLLWLQTTFVAGCWHRYHLTGHNYTIFILIFYFPCVWWHRCHINIIIINHKLLILSSSLSFSVSMSMSVSMHMSAWVWSSSWWSPWRWSLICFRFSLVSVSFPVLFLFLFNLFQSVMIQIKSLTTNTNTTHLVRRISHSPIIKTKNKKTQT